MQTGISLQALAKKIEDNVNAKKDFIATTNAMTMTVESNGAGPMLRLEDQAGEFPILPYAHKQIATHVKIPGEYYTRMLTTDPHLLATNVNAWFGREPTKRMVRTMHGQTRAFLSNGYQRIENEAIAKAAFPVIAELKGVQIVSCEVTDRKLYIQFVYPTIEGEVKKGDYVQAGGVISNSEVGDGSVSVCGLVWRLECLNGLKTEHAYRRNHVGRKIETSEELWADDTKASDDRTVLLKVRDMVRAVVDETRFARTLEKMRGLTDMRVTGDVNKSVEVLSQVVGASEIESEGILRSLILGADLSAWGLLNAVTHQAHTSRSYDRAVELEEAGGKLLTLPANDWKRILEPVAA